MHHEYLVFGVMLSSKFYVSRHYRIGWYMKSGLLFLFMVYLLVLIVLCLVALNRAEAGQTPCDQRTYDRVYREILLQALKSDDSQLTFDTKNDSIELLRKLCRGQKSTLEVINNEYKN